MGKLIAYSLAFIFIISACSFQADSFQYSSNQIKQSSTITNNSADYMQLCTDFILENHPDKTINSESHYNVTSIETNYQYTIFKAYMTPSEYPSGDSVIVSIRHDTLNIEFGIEQVDSDWDEYYNALPNYYKKIEQTGRLYILIELNYLPSLDDPILSNYSTEARIIFDPASVSLVEDYLNNYDYIIDIDGDAVTGNFTLETIVSLCNESYVNAVYFSTIYDYEPQSKQVPVLLILFIVLLVAIIAMVIIRQKVSKFQK